MAFSVIKARSLLTLHINPVRTGFAFLGPRSSHLESAERGAYLGMQSAWLPWRGTALPPGQQLPICGDLLACRRPVQPTLNNAFRISKEEKKC